MLHINAFMFFFVSLQPKKSDFFIGNKRSGFEFIFILMYMYTAFCSEMSMVRCYYKFWPIDVIGAIGGFLLIYRVVNWFFKEGKFPFLVWLGTNSLSILCFHCIEFKIQILSRLNCPLYLMFIMEMLFCVLMTKICWYSTFLRRILRITK